MNLGKLLSLVFIILVVLHVLSPAQTTVKESFTCKITKIIDGDTIDINCAGVVERVRLLGVQTPERGEKNFKKAALDIYGFTQNGVNIERFGVDKYKRTLGILDSSKGCVNVLMREKYKSTKYDKLLTKKQRVALKMRGWK